ncbi:MAG: hypothetical protein PVG54_10840 [Anaerolineae bacterium]
MPRPIAIARRAGVAATRRAFQLLPLVQLLARELEFEFKPAQMLRSLDRAK